MPDDRKHSGTHHERPTAVKKRRLTKRRTVAGYHPKGLRREEAFTDRAVAKIIDALPYPVNRFATVPNIAPWEEDLHASGGYPEMVTLPGRTLLKHRLNEAAQLFLFEKGANRPTETLLANEYQRIASAAKVLLARLGTPKGESERLPVAFLEVPGIDWAARQDTNQRSGFPTVSSRVALSDAIRGVERIRRWAETARSESANAAAALAELRDWLPEVPLDSPDNLLVDRLARTWREALGRSDINSKAFRGFVASVAHHLGRELKDDAIKKRVQRMGTRTRNS